MRRAIRILSVALITAGLVILADVGVTVAWEEPLSAVYSSAQQGKAESDLDEAREEFAASLKTGGSGKPGGRAKEQPEPSAAQTRRRAHELANRYERHLAPDKAIGKIIGSTIGVDQVFFQGTDQAVLQKGPGHYPDTALPGQGKTIGIAGHRSTYGAPFRHVDRARRGDEIVLEMPYGTFTYVVQGTKIVQPTEVSVVDDVGYERLVLTACHPVYSAAQRYVVFAKLDGIEIPEF